jgi:tetratricopeptide (TPR) repeat protein
LEIDKVVGYKVLEDHYHLWYIGKSYMDCYGKPNELPFGKLHSDEYCRRGIWYFERFLETTNAWDKNKVAIKTNEMCYFALVIMAQGYKFLGDIEKSIEHYKLAEQFSPSRNEHFLHLAFLLDEQQRYEELLGVLNIMMEPERVNPFPKYSFLIERRAYYNTGTLLQELKDRTLKKIEEPIIDMDSVKFEF